MSVPKPVYDPRSDRPPGYDHSGRPHRKPTHRREETPPPVYDSDEEAPQEGDEESCFDVEERAYG